MLRKTDSLRIERFIGAYIPLACVAVALRWYISTAPSIAYLRDTLRLTRLAVLLFTQTQYTLDCYPRVRCNLAR
jgi:hypothetical protein